MMAAAVYLLCALTSLTCAVLLTRGYLRSRSRLLLWSALCFTGLSAESVLVFADVVLFPSIDLQGWRIGLATGAVCLLLGGLIWESN